MATNPKMKAGVGRELTPELEEDQLKRFEDFAKSKMRSFESCIYRKASDGFRTRAKEIFSRNGFTFTEHANGELVTFHAEKKRGRAVTTVQP